MKHLRKLIGYATLALMTFLPGCHGCNLDAYKITEGGSLVHQLRNVNKEFKLSKVAQHVGVTYHEAITTHIPNDPTNTLNKLFSSAPIDGYSPCNRERKDQFPLREGEKTFPIEGSKYSDMDTFSGPIWPFLLEGFKDSEIYEKRVDGVDCGDKQLSELCTLGGLLAAVMGESYKAINAYTDNGKEINVDEMRTVLSNFVPGKDPVSLWEFTSGFQKILVEYNEPVVNYFTTHPTKQDPTDRQTGLVKELVTDRAYRADSSAKSVFLLFPARLMP